MALYTVVSGDTLAAIAARFSVSEADIRQANDLQAETVSVSQSLIIPICHFTPTGTAHPATLTTTDAPARRLITSTPGG